MQIILLDNMAADVMYIDKLNLCLDLLSSQSIYTEPNSTPIGYMLAFTTLTANCYTKALQAVSLRNPAKGN